MTRVTYWSGSKPVRWLRSKFGLTNPTAMSATDWETWRVECKKKFRFLHWVTSDGIDELQEFLFWPIDRLWDLRCALSAKFFGKYHYLPTKLNSWQYYDTDTRMLHGMFEALVDFIEIEKAWMNVISSREAGKKFGYKWYELNAWLSWFTSEKRHPLAGIAYLEWEMSLIKDESWYGGDRDAITKAKESGEFGKMTSQALAAQEQFVLYHWWKNIRPNRPDPYDASGYSEYFKKLETQSGSNFLVGLETQTEDLAKEGHMCSVKCTEIEEAYDKEDEEMLIRLIKIRKSLWT